MIRLRCFSAESWRRLNGKLLPKVIDLIAHDKVHVKDGRVFVRVDFKTPSLQCDFESCIGICELILNRFIRRFAFDLVESADIRVYMKERMSRMKVLIVGSGGREHAIAWKCRRKSYGR